MVKIEANGVCVRACVRVCVCVCVRARVCCWWPVSLALVIGSSLPISLFSSLCSFSSSFSCDVDKLVGCVVCFHGALGYEWSNRDI